MSEPDWKTALREDFNQNAWKIGGPYGDWDTDEAMAVAVPHIDAAYARGLMAGRSQAGYDTRRKRRETPCAPSVGPPSPASSTGDEP